MTRTANALTDNAARLIANILATDYNDGGYPATEIADYAWSACEGFDSAQSAAGTLSRAAAADLVSHEEYRDSDDNIVMITAKGWAAFTERFGACDESDFDAYTALAHHALRSMAALRRTSSDDGPTFW